MVTNYTLWLRAGSDGVRQAGDPSAHHIFMTLLLKAESDPSLKFDVRTINEARPPPEFKQAGLRHTPSLQIAQDEGLVQEDEIFQELDRFGPKFSRDQSAEDATADIFRQYAFYVKDVNKCSQVLTGEFKRVNDYLETAGTKFLTGDNPTCLDCLILPRIHSILIASKAIKEYTAPSDLSYFWDYMKNGYELESFKNSCPCDQEIVMHWAEKPGVSFSPSEKSKLSRQKPTFTQVKADGS